jgi:hypothetical protein
MMKHITDRPILALDISGSMVTGDGTTGQIFMCMSMDIGQGQKQAVHINQVIGKADLVVNIGSEVGGTEKIIHQAVHIIVTITEGKCPAVIDYSCCE